MNAAAPTSACWNCRQPLAVGTPTCLYCGVSQRTAAPMPPAPVGAASGPSHAVAPAAPGHVAPGTAVSGTGPTPARAPGSLASPSRPAGIALGPRFAGTVAATGPRLAAFTIDAVAVSAAAVGVALGTGSWLLGAITAAEAVVFLWVLEARTGLTVGNALLRVRTSRAEAPFSPGIGRAWVRQAVTGAGLFGLIAGAWVVVASGAFDATRQGRSWADKASRTIAVAVPKRQRAVATPGAALAPQPGIQRTPERLAPRVTGLGAAQVRGGLAPKALAIEDSMSMSQTGVPAEWGGAAASEQTAPPVVPMVGAAPAAAAPVSAAPAAAPVAPAPGIGAPPGIISAPPGVAPASASAPQPQPVAAEPVPAPASPAPAAAAPATPVPAGPQAVAAPATASAQDQGVLMLVFDTGQREQIPLPAVVNLGRKPSATDEGDHLISVADSEGTVSKTHLRLEHSHGRTWVTDGGSTNGTDLLDDDGTVIALAAGKRTEVQDGMRVRIGKRAFTISVLVNGASQ